MTSHAITNGRVEEPTQVGSHATATAPVFESLSVLDLFKIGIGPSSSHTVGPMRAALDFIGQADASGRFDEIVRLRVDLLGSLGATGSGHGTDTAIMLGGIISTMLSGALVHGHPIADAYRVVDAFVDLVAPRLSQS